MKRAVWRAILQNRVVINTAEEFAKGVQNECQKTRILFILKALVDETVTAELLARWEACTAEAHILYTLPVGEATPQLWW